MERDAMNAFVTYYKNLGHYNFAGHEKNWCVSLITPYGRVNEIWPEREEPDIDDLLPSEVLDLIESRLDSYWISTSREKDKATIAAIKEHAAEIDLAWLDAKIESTEKLLENMRDRRFYLAEVES
jgi:hypothetical protein